MSTILIIGATGQQGSALLSALSELVTKSQSPKPRLLALTRSVSSPKAQALTSDYPNLDIQVVEGNTKDPDPIFKAHPDITSIFSYTLMPDEEAQMLPLIRLAASPETKVAHLVFSSVDRGGDAASWDNPTDIPHFASKHHIEHALRDACEGSGGKLAYTVLRPTAFMDNLNPTSFFGRAFAALWWTMPADRPLQLVSVRDIGRFAARALLRPEEYRGRAIGLAGDDLTYLEARATYRRVAGAQLPQAWGLLGYAARWMKAEVGTMFTWFEEVAYGVDVEALRREDPELQSLEMWLRESSRFECSKSAK
ncbi:nucleoside-diphosphate-sugar epimerase family protein [Xylariaceae sp. FL0016]|nr:nucleoside-diphosphate-sugar epimerase family protein [Xylariaceae sp. FL0016]